MKYVFIANKNAGKGKCEKIIPKKYALNATAKVCKVNGIPHGDGIAICENIIIIATAIAVKTTFFVLLERSFILFSDIHH